MSSSSSQPRKTRARPKDNLRPGDWVEFYYPDPGKSLREKFPAPALGWGTRLLAQVVSIHGPNAETPTDLPCLVKVRMGNAIYPELIAIGDIRIPSPLELLAHQGEAE